jgi:hypothetical protein
MEQKEDNDNEDEYDKACDMVIHVPFIFYSLEKFRYICIEVCCFCKVMQNFLECKLQVVIVNTTIWNGSNAQYYFTKGKYIPHIFNLPRL